MRLRKLVVDALACVPEKTTIDILKRAALLSPWARSSLSCRLFAALAARYPNLSSLETNLGIDTRLRLRFPASNAAEIFGYPRLWTGQRASLDLALALLKDSDCFVDIGSHLGLFIYYLRHYTDESKPIYFFEPDPDLFSCVQENLTRNDLPNVHGFRLAVSDISENFLFYRSKSDDWAGSLVKQENHDLEPIEVRTTSFADFAAEYEIHNACVKVDTEGAEELVWKGMVCKLETVNALIIEILGPAFSRGFPARMIKDSGLNLYYINDYSLEPSSKGEFNYVAPFINWLLCRDAPTTLSHRLRGSRFTVALRN